MVTWVELAARGLVIDREPGPPTGIEGESYPLRVRIERAGAGIPLPGGELADPALDAPLAIEPGFRRGVEASVVLGRRGRRRLAPTTLVLRDPLRLRSREVSSAAGSVVLVLPRVEPVRGPGGTGPPAAGLPGGPLGKGEGERGSGRSPATPSAEVDGLRPHHEGAPASLIHWPTAARTGELFDRRLVSEAGSSHMVVLDPVGADEESLDRAVRAAGSLCLYLAPAGGCGLALPGGRSSFGADARLGGWPQAHAALALVEQTERAPVVRPARGGLTVWVRAALEPPSATELGALASRASHLVLAGELAGLRPVLSVAGCSGYSLAGAGRGRPPAERPGVAA